MARAATLSTWNNATLHEFGERLHRAEASSDELREVLNSIRMQLARDRVIGAYLDGAETLAPDTGAMLLEQVGSEELAARVRQLVAAAADDERGAPRR